MPTAQAMYDAYLTAEVAVLQGKRVKMGDREVGLEDLAEIRKGRVEWERKRDIEAAQATGRSNPGIALADLSQ